MRIEALTIFRFMAALIVVIFHFGQATGVSGILNAGSEMVTFFFVLSGFVMGLTYYEKSLFSQRYYWIARIARIAPVYYLALLIMVLLLDDGLTVVLFNILLIQAWISPYPLTVNPPGWSISVEIFFYFSFPFILLLIKKYNVSALTFGLFALIFWFCTQALISYALEHNFYTGSPSFSHDLLRYFPLIHFSSFILGIAGGIGFITIQLRITNFFISLIVIFGALYLVIYGIENIAIITDYLKIKIVSASSFFAPLFLFFILCLSFCQTRITRLFAAKPLVLLGEASYSLYILQTPVHTFYNIYLVPQFKLDALTHFMVYLFSLITVSIFSFLWFEKPVGKYIRFYLIKRTPP